MRARGLKLGGGVRVRRRRGVAPHAGAWIETIRVHAPTQYDASRPMRARGLKQALRLEIRQVMPSRPMRARGLKQEQMKKVKNALSVAPHAGAWIETVTK